MEKETTNNQIQKKTALITGASAGIGKAFAEVFAKNGFDLVLIARRESRLKEIEKSLSQKYGTFSTIIPCDLSDPSTPQYIFDTVQDKDIQIDALINNAGYGITGEFINKDWQTHKDFIQVLVTAVTHLCYLFIPQMKQRAYGRIINVASLNGIVPGSPWQTLYSGAKAFVVQLSLSLSVELEGSGVNVTAICPGLTYTEFHDVTGTREQVSLLSKYRWTDAQTVVEEGYHAVMEGEPVCINGKVNKFMYLVTKYLPYKMGIRLVAQTSKKMRWSS